MVAIATSVIATMVLAVATVIARGVRSCDDGVGLRSMEPSKATACACVRDHSAGGPVRAVI
eukprot:4776626-Pleurochrysis_carterae.AAC.1